MGLNFYIKPNAKLIEDKLELLKIESVHIGKSSHGWQFLFNHNDWKYFSREDKRSFVEFFENGIIIDETGQVWEHADFWLMVNQKKDLLNQDKYEGDTYFDKAIKYIGLDNDMAKTFARHMKPEVYYHGYRFAGVTNFS